MTLAVPAVLAPVAAGDFGRAPTAVGQWVGFSYMAAMFAGLASGTLVGRFGPVRVLQAAVLGVALGLAVGAGAHVALLLVCGALLGAAHGLAIRRARSRNLRRGVHRGARPVPPRL